jgi:hypothetical protein
MKTLITLVLLAATLILSGCSTLTNIPTGACTRWEHTGNYGPIFQTHLVFQGVTKTADGGLTVGSYDGTALYMGFGPHDHIEGLVIAPATVAAAEAKLTKP